MRIVQSNARLRALINKALAKEGQKILNRAAGNIQREVRKLVRAALSASPEIQSLSNGGLRYDFGLELDPSSQIIEAVVGSVQVDVSKIRFRSGNFTGGIFILVQPSDFANLLSLPLAQQAISGGSLPWLEWLLTRGDSVIIANFGVEYAPGRGRSGGAYMSRSEAPFKVNPLYSGTEEDNFITRALDKQLRQISKIIRQELT